MSSISKMTLSRSINNGMKGEVMGLRPTESVCNLPLKKRPNYTNTSWSLGQLQTDFMGFQFCVIDTWSLRISQINTFFKISVNFD